MGARCWRVSTEFALYCGIADGPPMAREVPAAMTATDREDLFRAVRLLEQPGLAAKLADMAGRPVSRALDSLPARVNDKLRGIVSDAMLQCLKVAISTLDTESRDEASGWLP